MSDEIDQMIADVMEAEDVPLPEPVEVPTTVGPIAPLPASLPATGALFDDNELLGVACEVLNNMRSDRKQLDSLISNFVEMVFNEGDSTTASKEALVSLMANKTNMSDKMMKIVELMAKFKLKEIGDSPKAVTASQENHYHFGGTRRSFLEQIDKKMQAKKKKDKESS